MTGCTCMRPAGARCKSAGDAPSRALVRATRPSVPSRRRLSSPADAQRRRARARAARCQRCHCGRFKKCVHAEQQTQRRRPEYSARKLASVSTVYDKPRRLSSRSSATNAGFDRESPPRPCAAASAPSVIGVARCGGLAHGTKCTASSSSVCLQLERGAQVAVVDRIERTAEDADRVACGSDAALARFRRGRSSAINRSVKRRPTARPGTRL